MMLNNKLLFIFDLDDTLVLEQNYVLSGFSAVASYIGAQCRLPSEEIKQFLHTTFLTQGREQIFDKLLQDYPAIAQQLTIAALVDIYRQHQPELKFVDGAEAVLTRLRADGKKIAIVTDGLASMQKQKTAALGLAAYVDLIIYCWEIGAPKPCLDGFKQAIKQLKVDIEDTVIIGDNPSHDIQPGVLLGVDTVRVLQGRFSRLDDLNGFSACCRGTSLKTIFEEHYEY
jgi:putative hydrolase of the HAD superfamily